jgi:protein regulator of cytokinesis 1
VVGSRANGGANGTPSRRLSLNAHQNGSRSTTKDGRRDNRLSGPVGPVNYVSILKDDAASHVSGTDTATASP